VTIVLLDDWPLGPATGLALLGSALAVALAGTGVLVASHPRRGRAPSDEVAEELARSARVRRYLRRRFDPGRATGLALTAALLVIFLTALAFGQVADMVTSRTGLHRLDAAAAHWGAAHATRTSTDVLLGLTWLGSTPVIIAVTVVLGLLEWYRRKRWTVLAFMVMVISGQNLIANGIKLFVHRERPPVPHLAASSGWSFPSGHTAAAAATCAAVALLLGRGRRWPVKAWLGTGAAAVVLAVASSRVLLGVHWLTDVIAGAALGFAWFAVCSIAFGGTILRFGATAEQARVAARREEATHRPAHRDGPP
jgi:membrane-associated phospholipid phosphatase